MLSGEYMHFDYRDLVPENNFLFYIRLKIISNYHPEVFAQIRDGLLFLMRCYFFEPLNDCCTMDPQLLNFIPNLRCPVSRKKLKLVDAGNLNKLNVAIAEGKAVTYEGETVTVPLQEALISADEKFIYPVVEGYIAGLLATKAIVAGDEIAMEKVETFSAEKKIVQKFYDDYGWVKTENGYNDTITFEDRRPVSEEYWSRCHLRLNNYLPGGEYLLDVASGSVPNDEYLTYSNRYGLRICMDFSLLAMQEAASRLNGKGIFILGDMTSIPLADDCIDSVISMHTVYHIPQQEQTKAVEEALRVIKPGGEAVIVYNWNKPLLMRLAFGVWKPLFKVYKLLRGKRVKKNKIEKSKTGNLPELFLQQQDYTWFLNDLKKPFGARIRVYSAISRSFSNTFLKEKAFGKQIASFVYWLEDKFPEALGRWGQYPVFILQKNWRSGSSVPKRVSRPAKQLEPGLSVTK